MRIDRKLNLVIPVDREDGVIYVHSMPISRMVYERYFLVLSKVYAAIFSEGLGTLAGPRIAALMLKKIAQDMGVWSGPDGVEAGLMTEIRRLSNVALLGANGWETLPMDDAVKAKMFSDDELAEAEGQAVFFIVVSAITKASDLTTMLTGLSKLWDAQITSLSCSDFANSLKISTEGETSGETVAGLSAKS